MLTFRQASINDLEKILQFERECFNQDDCFSKKNLQRMLLNPKKTIIVDLILADNMVIGYAVYLTRKNSKKTRLYSICISPEYSGQGFAKKYLLSRLEQFTSNFIEISLEVRCSNIKAINLYKNIGFKVVSTLISYYPDGEDGYKLIRKLH